MIRSLLVPLLAAVLLAACHPGPPAPPVPTPSPPPTDLLDAIRARGVLRVGADVTSPPMMWAAGDGSLQGFEHDVASALAAHLGVELQVRGMGWASQKAALTWGVVDVVVGGWVAPVEADVVATAPYLHSGLCLVVRRDSGISALADLAGRTVAIFDDPSARAWADARLNGSLVEVVQSGYLDLLAAGRVDAVVYDLPYALGELQPYLDRLEVAQINVSLSDYVALVPPGNEALQAALDEAIDGFRTGPGYGRSLARWLDPAVLGDALHAGSREPPPGARVHVIARGETLRALAIRYYQDEARWRDLWRANRDRLAFPDRLAPKLTLEVPP